ncbi:hypothetical protein ACIGMX_22945 [Streptomyces aquilus]|uniref:Uncharacterized protein n=1 Tax=Streptomyces aquilus TaxID=2548456 RepID=A0A3S9IGF0_9ACTN|nr:hypothetical protein [Streptomyces aquilus]AZP23343.1 hypothetical protein EJC51_19995 [Streptomyces aquilus]
MDPETHLALHQLRAADLRAQAEAHRLATEAKPPRALRSRVGWTLVELGLRLAASPRPALA